MSEFQTQSEQQLDANTALIEARNVVAKESAAILGVVSAAQIEETKIYSSDPKLSTFYAPLNETGRLKTRKTMKQAFWSLPFSTFSTFMMIWGFMILPPTVVEDINNATFNADVFIGVGLGLSICGVLFGLWAIAVSAFRLKFGTTRLAVGLEKELIAVHRKISEVTAQVNDEQTRLVMKKASANYRKLLTVTHSTRINRRELEEVIKECKTIERDATVYTTELGTAENTLIRILASCDETREQLKKLEAHLSLANKGVPLNQTELSAAAEHLVSETSIIVATVIQN